MPQTHPGRAERVDAREGAWREADRQLVAGLHPAEGAAPKGAEARRLWHLDGDPTLARLLAAPLGRRHAEQHLFRCRPQRGLVCKMKLLL